MWKKAFKLKMDGVGDICIHQSLHWIVFLRDYI